MRSVDVQIENGHTDPIGIVRAAKTYKRAAQKDDPYDQVWCVFDVEAKQGQVCRHGLAEAMRLAADAGINVAFSNPCFEIWLLWHTADHAAWICSEDAQRRCKGLNILIDGKHLKDVEILISRYGSARERAVFLENWHDKAGNQNPEDRNPSSRVHRLIHEIFDAFPARE